MVKINLAIWHHCWTGHGTKSSKFVCWKKLRTDFHISKLKSPILQTWSRFNNFRMSGQQSEWISKAEDIADKVGHIIYLHRLIAEEISVILLKRRLVLTIQRTLSTIVLFVFNTFPAFIAILKHLCDAKFLKSFLENRWLWRWFLSDIMQSLCTINLELPINQI